MQQDGHGLFPGDIPGLCLPGAGLAQDHRVHRLKMRGIGGQRQVDRVTIEDAVCRGAQVVLHVSRTADILGMRDTILELRHDGPVGLQHDVGQHVEPSAVRHAQIYRPDAELRAPLENLFNGRNGGFAAIEAKALGARMLEVQEAFEPFGLGQTFEDGPFTPLGEMGLVADALDALLYPGFFLGILDVHELDADRAAVSLFENLEDFPQRCGFESEHLIDEDRAIHIRHAESPGFRVEFRMVLFSLQTERINLGQQMTAYAKDANDHQCPNGIQRSATNVRIAENLRCPGPQGRHLQRRGAIRIQRSGPDWTFLARQAGKKGRPTGFYRVRISEKAVVQLGKVRRILRT